MPANPTETFSSKLPWPKGAIEDWQNGWSYGELAKKYGRSYSGIVKQVRQAKMLGAARVAGLAERRKNGSKPYLDQSPLSPVHHSLGIKINRFRELEHDMNFAEFSKLVQTNRMVARKMELGIHDFTLSQLINIGGLLQQPIEDLLKPASIRK